MCGWCWGWGVAQVLEVTRKRIKTKCIQLQRLPEICQRVGSRASEINVKTSKSAQGNAQAKGYKCSKGLGI